MPTEIFNDLPEVIDENWMKKYKENPIDAISYLIEKNINPIPEIFYEWIKGVF